MVSFHFPHKSIHAHWSCQIFKNPTRNPTFLQRGSNPGHVFSVRSQKGAHPACLFPSVMAEYFTEEQVSEHFGQHGLWLLVPQNVPEVMMYIIFVYRIFILHIHLFIYLFFNTCVHMYIYIYIYIYTLYIHTCIYIYIHYTHLSIVCVCLCACLSHCHSPKPWERHHSLRTPPLSWDSWGARIGSSQLLNSLRLRPL